MARTFWIGLMGLLRLPTFDSARLLRSLEGPVIWTCPVRMTELSSATTEEAPCVPSGAARALPDLIFGTALTPQQKPLGES